MRRLLWLAILTGLASCFSASAINIENWQEVFSGYGSTGITSKRIILEPKASDDPEETHAALVIGPESRCPFLYQVTVRTLRQLRKNSEPNPWEAGWVIWHYQDNDHFYYFIPKPNGWELGKRDPSYAGGQRFMATGDQKKFVINKKYRIKIIQRKKIIKIYVDNKKIVEYLDQEAPYQKGRIGVYSEDAKAKYTNIKHRHLKKQS